MKKNSFPNQDLPASGGQRLTEPCSESAVRIGRSIAYMNQHLDQPLQVAVLAAQANISPSHFFALFKRQTGSPPIDYFIRLRMNRACQLLDSTTSSVKEVAAALGYSDPFYFSRLFKSVNQVAPTEYRQIQRGLGAGERTTRCSTLATAKSSDVSVRAEFVVTGSGFEPPKKYQLLRDSQ